MACWVDEAGAAPNSGFGLAVWAVPGVKGEADA